MEYCAKVEEMRIIGNKMYDVCYSCGKIIQRNKFLFGDLHICTTEEERKQFGEKIQAIYKENLISLNEANK